MKKTIYILTGILFLIYLFALNMLSTAKIAFSVPLGVFSVILIIYGLKMNEISRFINSIPCIRKIMKICLTAILLLIMSIEFVIIAYPKHDTSYSDYILVLGAGLTNGKKPSEILKYRLNAVIEYIDTYNNTGKIIVSGGKGNDEQISEAEAMKNYLVDKGVSEERILVENNSKNTYENFEFSKKVIENDSKKSIEDVKVKIVTTDFHAFRSRFLAGRNNYSNVSSYSSPTIWYMIPISYLREGFAVIKSFLFD